MKLIHDKARLRRAYLNLIAKAIEENGRPRNRRDTKPGFEIHHPIPRSWFPEDHPGRDHPDNLAYLTYRQHFIAHLLLKWLCGEEMNTAFLAMCYRFADGKKVRVSARQFQIAKEGVRAGMLGKPSRAKGYVFTEDQINRLKKALTGRTLPDSQKQRMSEVKRGKPRDEATRRKISETKTGVPKPTGICPYCGGVFGLNMLGRWHGDNCKHKPAEVA